MKRPYEVQLTTRAERDLEKLPPMAYRIVRQGLLLLAADPRPSGCKKLQGRGDQYRIRRGDYRIIYEVEDAILRVLVVEVGNRRDIYLEPI